MRFILLILLFSQVPIAAQATTVTYSFDAVLVDAYFDYAREEECYDDGYCELGSTYHYGHKNQYALLGSRSAAWFRYDTETNEATCFGLPGCSNTFLNASVQEYPVFQASYSYCCVTEVNLGTVQSTGFQTAPMMAKYIDDDHGIDAGTTEAGNRLVGFGNNYIFALENVQRAPAVTPVPLPAGGWFLFAGLGFLIGLRRLRS